MGTHDAHCWHGVLVQHWLVFDLSSNSIYPFLNKEMIRELFIISLIFFSFFALCFVFLLCCCVLWFVLVWSEQNNIYHKIIQYKSPSPRKILLFIMKMLWFRCCVLASLDVMLTAYQHYKWRQKQGASFMKHIFGVEHQVGGIAAVFMTEGCLQTMHHTLR